MGPAQLTGRTDGDQIVHFDTPGGTAPERWIGAFVKVRIESASALSLRGVAVG
jgi:tRNA A37 methylthiotransferase MiaB